MLWIFLESPRQSDSNKYPGHIFIFLGKIRGKISHWYMLGFFVAVKSF